MVAGHMYSRYQFLSKGFFDSAARPTSDVRRATIFYKSADIGGRHHPFVIAVAGRIRLGSLVSKAWSIWLDSAGWLEAGHTSCPRALGGRRGAESIFSRRLQWGWLGVLWGLLLLFTSAPAPCMPPPFPPPLRLFIHPGRPLGLWRRPGGGRSLTTHLPRPTNPILKPTPCC